MSDKDFIELLLDNQEWETFECKRALVSPNKALETIVAFANTEGGSLAIGLEDPLKAQGDKRLTGIKEGRDNPSELLKLIGKEIQPPLRLYNHFTIPIRNNNKEKDHLLIINCKKSSDVYSLRKGDTFIRRGNQNVKIGSQEIIRLQYEKGSVKFEDEISNISSLEELDAELFKSYKAVNQGERLDDWQFLKNNGLASKKDGKSQLTKAGVLLFGKNPTILLKSKCGIKISSFHGTRFIPSGEPTFTRRPFTIEGPLLIQIQRAIEFFRGVLSSSPPKLRGSAFKSSLVIPEWAYQEAITNAVIHRNYFLQDDIQVRFFDDRIEIESPGTYPGHITVSNIRAERFARNPIIQRTLNRFKEPPNLDIGEGVDRMFIIMKQKNLYNPIYLPPNLRPNSVMLALINLQKVEHWDTVSKYLDKHIKITNNEARKITGISDTLKMSRLLKSWVDNNLLKKMGGGAKKSVYYIKMNQDITTNLFSKKHENN